MLRSALRVGVFVTATVAMTAYIAASIVDFAPGRARYTLSATFGDVAGLRAGDEVKLAGIPVGEVSGIDVDDGQAVVSFAVDDDVRIPADSTVSVRWLNLIGQRYLSLVAGDGTSMLGDGDVVARSENVVDLGRLVTQLAPLARSVSPEHLNRILAALLETFEGNDAAFDGLLADLGVVLDTLADREATIDQLLVDYDAVAGALASRDAQIQSMVSNLAAIAQTFAENDALLEQALDVLPGFTSGLDELLTASADDLGASLASLAVLTGTAADHVTELEAALRALPELFEGTLPAVNRGEWLRVSVLCLTLAPGPCPIPPSLGHELAPEGGS